MTKGKLYENARYKHSAPGLTVILHFIDEAKKEFPHRKPELYHINEHDVEAWFKKWFGDEK